MALTQVHRQTLICSANRLNNRIYNYGYANVINYGVLSLIYNLLDSDLMIEYDKIRLLEHLAEKIETIDPDICTPKIDGGKNYPEGDIDNQIVIPNTAPTVEDAAFQVQSTVTTAIFTQIVFTTNFSDADLDGPGTVNILSLPSQGTLFYNNVAIGVGFTFAISNVGLLTYVRSSNLAYITSFLFRISDNNDNPLFSNVATVTIDVLANVTNQPATIGDQSISVSNRATTTLTLAMFTSTLSPPYSDPENDLIDAIRIDEVSTANVGQFLFNNIAIVANQVITREDINAGLFVHVGPDQDAIAGDVFNFSARDEGSGIWIS